MLNPQAIFLMGPTAAGKSALALALSEHLPIEIISVDSAMIYRGMDIGTGKPGAEEMAKVPHHLVNIRDPKEAYSAAEFAKDALKHMKAITSRGHIPVLVGGTLLYFRALQEGLSSLPSADPSIREALLKKAGERGWAALHQQLTAIDPQTAARIHPNDPQRIQRALEVYEITGKPMSSFFTSTPKTSMQNYHLKAFALAPTERQELHQRIELRFYHMLEQGLIAEVETLFKRGDLNLELPSMRAVGYRQIWEYLSGAYSYQQMISRAIAATRQLAKRQLTWLRSLSYIEWLPNNHLASLKSMINCDS